MPSPVRKRKDKDRDKERRRKRSRDRSTERSAKRRRSLDRDRDRHRSRSRSREREKRRSRSRSRTFERRSYERSPGPSSSRKHVAERPVLSAADLEGKTPEEQEMMKVMGFAGFDTTKGKKVDGNNAGEVHVILKRKYRQYMNRKGGFNRPLDFVA